MREYSQCEIYLTFEYMDMIRCLKLKTERYSIKFFIFTVFMALLKVICWAIIFITRIHFPPGKSLATILIHRYVASQCRWRGGTKRKGIAFGRTFTKV